MVAAEWDNDVCGGGGSSLHPPVVLALLMTDSPLVWWSSAHTYKNAITNELFLLTSAQAYTRTGNKNETYLQNALKVGWPFVSIVSTTVYRSDQEYKWCTSLFKWGCGTNYHALLQ